MQTDTQTRVTTIHFASFTTHAKCNDDAVWLIGLSEANINGVGYYSLAPWSDILSAALLSAYTPWGLDHKKEGANLLQSPAYHAL